MSFKSCTDLATKTNSLPSIAQEYRKDFAIDEFAPRIAILFFRLKTLTSQIEVNANFLCCIYFLFASHVEIWDTWPENGFSKAVHL